MWLKRTFFRFVLFLSFLGSISTGLIGLQLMRSEPTLLPFIGEFTTGQPASYWIGGCLISFVTGISAILQLSPRRNLSRAVPKRPAKALPVASVEGADSAAPPLLPTLTNWEKLINSTMSEIWTAFSDDQKLLIKFPRLSGTISQTLLHYRFNSEIDCHQQLEHTNIVKLLEYGVCHHPETDAETPYLIQPYLNALDLRHLIQKVPMPLFEAAIQDIVGQLLDALEHLHNNSIIHRDLSLTNILLDDESGRLYLIDFGNATTIGSNLTRVEGLDEIGTIPFYPLHIGNQPARDLFAVGVILYALYGGTLAAQSRESIAFHEEKLLAMNHVPAYINEVMQRCWRGDFNSVAELRAALRYPRHQTITVVRRVYGESEPIADSDDEEHEQTDSIGRN